MFQEGGGAVSKYFREFWSVLDRFRGLKLQGVSEGLTGVPWGVSEESHGVSDVLGSFWSFQGV